jgi:hypothetical protein
VVIYRHRRSGHRDRVGYVHIALKILSIIGLLGALHIDPTHALVYVPAIVTIAVSHKLSTLI